jgi:hypothetical protein
LVASIIGILGFLTGISNAPSLLTNAKTWFGSSIPYWVSIPVFMISLLFIYGVYFLMLCRIYKWLFARRAISEIFSILFLFELALQTIRHLFPFQKFIDYLLQSFRILRDERIEGNIFSVTFFMLFGIAISALLFQAFFDVPATSLWINEFVSKNINGNLYFAIIILGVFGFLYLLCITAQNTGIEQSKRKA